MVIRDREYIWLYCSDHEDWSKLAKNKGADWCINVEQAEEFLLVHSGCDVTWGCGDRIADTEWDWTPASASDQERECCEMACENIREESLEAAHDAQDEDEAKTRIAMAAGAAECRDAIAARKGARM